MDNKLGSYLEDLVRSVRSILRDGVNAMAVGGSIGFDDFHPDMSDVDVALFLRDAPTAAQLSTLSLHLDHRELPCPGKGLDLMAFDRESVAATPPLPQAVFGFVTGATWRTELSGAEKCADLLVDLFVLRHHGRSVFGPNPEQIIGSIDKSALRSLVADVVTWHRTRIHDPFHDPTGAFAVLNACRAWRFLSEGIMGSKTAGGEWAMARRERMPVIEGALALRFGEGIERLDQGQVLKFLDVVDEEIAGSIDAGVERPGTSLTE